jgi:hypothetical protein
VRSLAIELFSRQLSDSIFSPLYAIQLAAFLFIWEVCCHSSCCEVIRFSTVQFLVVICEVETDEALRPAERSVLGRR